MAGDWRVEAATRVLIISRDALSAQSIQSALERTGLTVQVGDHRQRCGGPEGADQGTDVVLVEFSQASPEAVEYGRAIVAGYPQAKVLALTSPEDVEGLQAAARAGFHGCVTTDASLSQLLGWIRGAREGHLMRPETTAARAAQRRSDEARAASLMAEQLTPRELDVLCLLAGGERSDSIAQLLSLSPHTVRTHIQNILTKLQVHSRLAAVAFALRHGVVADRLAAELTGQPYV